VRAVVGRGDRPALIVTGLVAVPIVAGLLTSGAHAPQISDAVVAAGFLVAWLLVALPVAVLVGRWTDRHITGLDEEEQ
jgi:hypothetical protein